MVFWLEATLSQYQLAPINIIIYLLHSFSGILIVDPFNRFSITRNTSQIISEVIVTCDIYACSLSVNACNQNVQPSNKNVVNFGALNGGPYHISHVFE